MFCKDIINYLIFSDTVCCYNIFSCELSLRKFTVFWSVGSCIDLIGYCLLHIAQFIHVVYIDHWNIRMICFQFFCYSFFSLKSCLWFGILNEQHRFSAVAHLFRKSLCRFLSCSYIVCGYICSHTLIIWSGIKSYDRNLTVCCKIKLHLACLQVYDRNAHCDRISVQFFIQKIYLVIDIICCIRCIKCYFHLIFSCIPKICINIFRSLRYTFFHFIPVLCSVRFSDNGNIIAFFQL